MDIVYENQPKTINYAFAARLSPVVHLHKELELIYVKKGKAIAYADKNSHILNEGDLFLTFPNQVHYYETVSEGYFIILVFSPSILHGESPDISQSVPDTNYIPAGKADFKDIFDKMLSLPDAEYGMLAMNGYINIAMSLILPHLTLKTVSGEKNSAFYSIVDFCGKNFKGNLTLDYLAESLHLSKYYISHLINNKLHQSFTDYINNLRISEACSLLKNKNKKIADISEEVGFGTIRSFNRSFKQIMGVSPLEYRAGLDSLKKSVY